VERPIGISIKISCPQQKADRFVDRSGGGTEGIVIGE